MTLSFHITGERKKGGPINITLALGMKSRTYSFATMKECRRWFRRDVISAVRRFGIEMMEAFNEF